MGLQIGSIVSKKSIEFSELKDKIILVDAFNALYQFLTTIRQPDGTPLMDSKGRVTSHLSGLFYRNLNLLQEGMKLVYVFDGKAPAMKKRTQEKRAEVKDEAREKYEQAVEEENIEEMGKYAKQLAFLNEEMIQESKELLKAMGMAVIQAPAEGEAQASFMASHDKNIFAVASQDYDALMFKAPRLIQNLTLARKRKTISGFVEVTPQIIELKEVLKELNINQEQLICLAILSGTDYNPGGVKGIGPKKALKLVQEHKTKEKIFSAIENFEKEGKYKLDFDWKEIYDLINNPEVDKNAKIEFPKMNIEKIKKILLEHDFSEERINNQIEKLNELKEKQKQRTLF